jgi:hypothetical protein
VPQRASRGSGDRLALSAPGRPVRGAGPRPLAALQAREREIIERYTDRNLVTHGKRALAILERGIE